MTPYPTHRHFRPESSPYRIRAGDAFEFLDGEQRDLNSCGVIGRAGFAPPEAGFHRILRGSQSRPRLTFRHSFAIHLLEGGSDI